MRSRGCQKQKPHESRSARPPALPRPSSLGVLRREPHCCHRKHRDNVIVWLLRTAVRPAPFTDEGLGVTPP